jgi:hypothetical protein
VSVVDCEKIEIIHGLCLFLFESRAWAPNSRISFSILLNLAEISDHFVISPIKFGGFQTKTG